MNDKRSDEVLDKEPAEGGRDTVESAIETDATGKPARAEVPGDDRQGVASNPLPEEKAEERKAK